MLAISARWRKKFVPQKFRLFSWLFILSGAALTWVLSRVEAGHVLISAAGIMGSLGILWFITFRRGFVEHVFKQLDYKRAFLAVLFSLVAWYYHGYKYFIKSLNFSSQIYIRASLAFLSVFAIFVLFAWLIEVFIPIGKDFFTSLDQSEMYYLIISVVVVSLGIIWVYRQTNVFFNAPYNDLVYNTDSSSITSSNANLYINSPKNNIKQPLYGLFALPFAIPAKILSRVLFFVPNSYSILLSIVQVTLLQITLILIGRMLNLTSTDKILFFLLFNFTYPFLLFSLVTEQYIFGLFWLILFFYTCLMGKNNKALYFIGAVGSMLTSGIVFPLLSNARRFRDWFKEIALGGVKLLGVLVVFGQLSLIAGAYTDIQMQLTSWTGAKLTFADKFLQYLNFAAACFVKPFASIDATYHLAPVTAVNLLGILVLLLALLGFVTNAKNKFAQISLGWVLYSLLMLCVIGWGTRDNDLILYALYFSWAFVALAFLAITSLLKKWPAIAWVVMSILIVALAIINLPGIAEIVQWGMRYYPN
jgi:hypothetical protein